MSFARGAVRRFSIALVLSALSGAAPAQLLAKADVDAWRGDLRTMAAEMKRLHPDLFHATPREAFEAACADLDRRIPILQRDEIVVGLAKIAALVGDGHTNVSPTRDAKVGFHEFPVRLYFFSDGLFVRSAARAHVALVGEKVVAIGGIPAAEAYSRVRSIVGRDNEQGALYWAPLLLAMPEVVHALGLSDSAVHATFTLERGGVRHDVTLAALQPYPVTPSEPDLSWEKRDGWVDARDGAEEPLWLRDASRTYWTRYLPDSRVLYVRIGKIESRADRPLEEFCAEIVREKERLGAAKVVFDLRLNRGGYGDYVPLLVRAGVKLDEDRKGVLFVVISRATFSAAQFLADDLDKYTYATFVGEPTGSKGNHFGDSRKIVLPGSGITARVATRHWQDWPSDDPRSALAPAVPAPLSFDDYRRGIDPALRAIASFRSE